ncbi:hypothetical protein Agub_g11090, partial [Astrephomene gubernaculifera]
MASKASRLDALLEVAALQATYGTESVTILHDNQNLVDLAAAGSLEEEEAAARLGQSKGLEIALCHRHTCPCASDREEAGGAEAGEAAAAAAAAGQLTVEVKAWFRLPPGYPSCCCSPEPQETAEAAGAAAAATRQAAVHYNDHIVSKYGCPACCTCRRTDAVHALPDAFRDELAEVIRSAAEEGRPCLHELWEVVRCAAVGLAEEEWRRRQQPCPRCQGQEARSKQDRATTVEGPPMAPKEEEEEKVDPLQVLLLKLDHMHSRALYVRTITAWARELRLTGRLIFQGNLILVLLEGEADAVRQYLVRHRTENVDVDSRGRKCKERMLQVIVQAPHPLTGGASQQQQQGSAAGSRSAAAGVSVAA